MGQEMLREDRREEHLLSALKYHTDALLAETMPDSEQSNLALVNLLKVLHNQASGVAAARRLAAARLPVAQLALGQSIYRAPFAKSSAVSVDLAEEAVFCLRRLLQNDRDDESLVGSSCQVMLMSVLDPELQELLRPGATGVVMVNGEKLEYCMP